MLLSRIIDGMTLLAIVARDIVIVTVNFDWNARGRIERVMCLGSL